jgi:ribokinase
MILCIGDIDIDLTVAVPHTPEGDGKVSGALLARGPGGMMANVAVGLARLGSPVRLLATVGDDADGETAVAAVAREGVDTRFIAQVPGASTFLCFVMVTPNGEKSLVRVLSRAYLPPPSALNAAVFADVSHAHMTFGDAALAEAALAAASAHGVSVSLDLEAADLPTDPAPLARALAQVDTLFMSAGSAAAATALLGARPSGRKTTIVTKGAAGAEAFGPDGRAEAPAPRVTPVDTTGAGDAFAAAFLHAEKDGATLQEALAFANAAAALSTQGVGAQTALPRKAEIARLLADMETSQSNA